MPKIKVIKPFKFAHHGTQVEDFEPSDEARPTTQEVVDILKDEGLFEVLPEDAALPVEDPSAGARFVLQLAMDALPGGATDATFVVLNLREQFGEMFTDADEAKVRDLVKADGTAPAPAAQEAPAAPVPAPVEQPPAPPATAPAPAAKKTTKRD